ncbi:MAG: hypothetical protein ACI8QZ_001360 [Chlamydiales bacterium]|jgi:hypothetical protein
MCEQHAAYVAALRALSLEDHALEEFPDAQFVERTAEGTTEPAVTTRPGAHWNFHFPASFKPSTAITRARGAFPRPI